MFSAVPIKKAVWMCCKKKVWTEARQSCMLENTSNQHIIVCPQHILCFRVDTPELLQAQQTEHLGA